MFQDDSDLVFEDELLEMHTSTAAVSSGIVKREVPAALDLDDLPGKNRRSRGSKLLTLGLHSSGEAKKKRHSNAAKEDNKKLVKAAKTTKKKAPASAPLVKNDIDDEDMLADGSGDEGSGFDLPTPPLAKRSASATICSFDINIHQENKYSVIINDVTRWWPSYFA